MSINRNILKLLIVLLFIINFSQAHYETLNSVQITNDDMFYFNWQINPEENLIKFTMDVKTKGWAAIGFSPSGSMIGADMYLGYIKKDGTASLKDYYSKDRVAPTEDLELGGKSDILEVTGKYSNSRSTITFVRKLVTGDKYDFDISQGEKYNILFAWRTDGTPETEGKINIHTGKIVKQLILYPKTGQKVDTETLADKYKPDPEISVTKLQFSNLEIPLESTAYICRLFNVNKIINETYKSGKKSTTYHAIGFEPLIDNEQFVHHIVVYACNYKNVFYDESYFRCEGNPKDCFQTVVLWAVGQKTFEFPPEAGLIWGTFETYFVTMQIHYSNPSKVPNQKDSSGFAIYYTPKLRPYDVGVAYLGPVVMGIEVPPKVKDYKVSTVCPSSCLSNLPKDGFNIVLYSFHAHTLGRKIRLIITNPDGTIDDTTFRDDAYDFNHQRMITMNPPYVIKKGSKIQTICEYDSMDKTTITRGGLGTDDEMCVVYAYYYPIENGIRSCSDDYFEDGETKTGYCALNKKIDRSELDGWAANSSYLKLTLTTAFFLIMNLY